MATRSILEYATFPRPYPGISSPWMNEPSSRSHRAASIRTHPSRTGAIVVTRSEETTATAGQKAGRTAQLLALMTKGDDMFNARDFAALDAVHHPDMIAYIPGNAQPIYGRSAHAVAMRQPVQIFPDIHVHTPYPTQFGSGDWLTVVTRATGTFSGEMVLPNGKVIAPPGKHSTWNSAKPQSGMATGSSSSRPSSTPRCRRSSSASPSSCLREEPHMPRPLILFIHITAAMGVFAAMGIEGVALLQLRRVSSLAQLQAAVNGLRLMQRVMALSALTLVLSGLYLAGSAWGWSVPWINLGFASLVAAAVLGGATTGRTIGRVQAGASDQLRAPLLGISYRTRIAMLIGIVFLM